MAHWMWCLERSTGKAAAAAQEDGDHDLEAAVVLLRTGRQACSGSSSRDDFVMQRCAAGGCMVAMQHWQCSRSSYGAGAGNVSKWIAVTFKRPALLAGGGSYC